MTERDDRIQRERDFWDHEVPTADEEFARYRSVDDPNTLLMVESINPRPGMKVLDFACGAGLSSMWLADRGADVTAVDLSPASIHVAREVARRAGHDGINFVCGDVEEIDFPEGGFDAIVGRYALHHLDIPKMAPVLASCIKPGGRGAFLETFGTNPLLNWARNNIAGRFGVPKFGTVDEHPLVQTDLDSLAQAFSSVEVAVADFKFLSMLDRQVFRYRSRPLTNVLLKADEVIRKSGRVPHWSFHQVVIVEKGP